MPRPSQLCQPGLHISPSTSCINLYFVSNVSLPETATILWEWNQWSPMTNLPPYFTELCNDLTAVRRSMVFPDDRVHLLGFRFRDLNEFIDSLGRLSGVQEIERLSIKQLFFDKYPSIASLSVAFQYPLLGGIRELTIQLFHGVAVEFPAPVLIELLAHCKYLEHVHFRGCGFSDGKTNSLRGSGMWQRWLSLSHGNSYTVIKKRSMGTISFKDVDCQRIEDVLGFLTASESPFYLGGLRRLSIPSLAVLEPASAVPASICTTLKTIIITACDHLEVLRLSFPLGDDSITLPRLRTLGLYVRKRAKDGTELLRWGAEILNNGTMAQSIEIGFTSALIQCSSQDERQQPYEGDINLLDLIKQRHSVGQDIHTELSDLISSFDGLDEVLAARIAQGAVTNVQIIGPSRDNSALLRNALFPRSMIKFQLCRIPPSIYR